YELRVVGERLDVRIVLDPVARVGTEVLDALLQLRHRAIEKAGLGERARGVVADAAVARREAERALDLNDSDLALAELDEIDSQAHPGEEVVRIALQVLEIVLDHLPAHPDDVVGPA